MVPNGSQSHDTIVSSPGPCKSESHQAPTAGRASQKEPENAPAHYPPYHKPAPIASIIFGSYPWERNHNNPLPGVDIHPS
jgi:hypothetical protein